MKKIRRDYAAIAHAYMRAATKQGNEGRFGKWVRLACSAPPLKTCVTAYATLAHIPTRGGVVKSLRLSFHRPACQQKVCGREMEKFFGPRPLAFLQINKCAL